MNKQTPFSLDVALAAWRRSLQHCRVILPDDLDELEQHVRDEVASLAAQGLSDEQAFRAAMRRMGDYGETEAAYRDVYWGKLRRHGRLRDQIATELAMLTNYVKIALRSLLRRKGYAFINLFGLAAGLAASLLILQYVAHELSYDDFHADAEQLYRVRLDVFREGERLFKSATTYPGVGPALADALPEVEAFARLYLWNGGGVMRVDGESFREDLVFSADSSFLTLFSYPMLRGDRRTALDAPNTAVLSADAARKFFGSEDPVGKRFRFGSDQEYEVTGVVASPENSHLTFNVLLSFSTLPQVVGDQLERYAWNWYDFYTYLKLRPGTDAAALEARLPDLVATYKGERARGRDVLSLQPLHTIHLHSDLLQEARVNGSATSVYFLTTIALLILVIAWVNYVNLSTARALERAKEIGIRKVLGAHRRQLIRQFLLESILLNLAAAGLAVGLAWLARPLFDDLAGQELGFALAAGGRLGAALALLFVAGAFLSGVYPALVLSAYKPAAVLKGAFAQGRNGLLLRKGLVVGQFAASVGLVAGTLVVYQQLDYMRSQDLGVDIERTLVLRGPDVVADDSLHALRLEAFKQALRAHPHVRSTAASTEIPGNLIYWTNGARKLQDDPADAFTMYQVGIDPDFLDGYGHRLLAGRGFAHGRGTDAEHVVLNEAALASLQLTAPSEAVGERLRIGGDTLTVAGVVADFHQEGLQKGFYPIAFRLQPQADQYFSIKVQTADLPAVIAFAQEQFTRFFPDNPTTYFFLDQHFEGQYRRYQQFGKLFGFFALLAVAVACLGLCGLASFAAAQRAKEIGIRKVLGASLSGILVLLSKDFLKLVLVAALLAVPVVWLLMGRWLERFAFRIEMPLWPFLAATALTLLLALLTVSYQSLKAALADPVDTLRYE